MIARSQPVAIRTKPDPPEDDAKRLADLWRKVQIARTAIDGNLAALDRHLAEIDRLTKHCGTAKNMP